MASNRFAVLDDEVSVKSTKGSMIESIDFNGLLARAFEECGLDSSTPAAKKKPKSSGDQATGKKDLQVAEIVAEVILAIQPIIIKTVTAAVSTAVSGMMAEIAKLRQQSEASPASSQNRDAMDAVDRLEQYGRRENVRIYGLEETPRENTTLKVIELAADMGVQLKADDISISHRLPISRRRQGADAKKPVIVKFVRRSSKEQLMRKKKELRNKESRRRVFIEEDLTPLRSRIFRAVKAEENVKTAWSIDGRINFIRRAHDGREEKVVIDGLKDMAKLNWSPEKIKKFQDQ